MEYRKKVESRLSELDKGDLGLDDSDDERQQLLKLRKQASSADQNSECLVINICSRSWRTGRK